MQQCCILCGTVAPNKRVDNRIRLRPRARVLPALPGDPCALPRRLPYRLPPSGAHHDPQARAPATGRSRLHPALSNQAPLARRLPHRGYRGRSRRPGHTLRRRRDPVHRRAGSWLRPWRAFLDDRLSAHRADLRIHRHDRVRDASTCRLISVNTRLTSAKTLLVRVSLECLPDVKRSQCTVGYATATASSRSGSLTFLRVEGNGNREPCC